MFLEILYWMLVIGGMFLEILFWMFVIGGSLFVIALFGAINAHQTLDADPCDPNYRWFHERGANNVSIWEALRRG